MTLSRVLASAAGIIGATVAATLVIDVRPLMAGATIVATISLAGLVAHYARTAPWWASRVGRTTLGLWVSMLALALGAGLRRVSEVSEVLEGRPVDWARIGGDHLVAAAWLLIAVAATALLLVVRALQRGPVADECPMGGRCPKRTHRH